MLLVIEHDPKFTEKFKQHLKVGQLRPFFVETGKDALFLLESMKACFMLINLNGIRSWEELNGLTTYAREHHVPYLFIEGLRKTQEIADRLRQKGFDTFIQLPFNVKTLSRRISTLLELDTMLGRKIGPAGQQVELQAKLGTGATGLVYQAYQPELDRQVAVKFLTDEHIGDKEAVKRFHNEARAIAQMRSPHIVQVYFVGMDADIPYLVMEYINGPTMEKYLLSKGALKPMRALKLAREILLGLVEAHGAQKIHRDLKPANIMLNRRGQVVILDFGLVRDSGAGITQTGMVMGTPRYISPEQVQGHAIDARCDLYSLGIILYEMLLGELPYKGDDLVSLLWKHVKEPLPKPSDEKQLDPALWKILETLCAKLPQDRFESAEAALRAIDAYLEQLSQGGMTITHTRTLDLLRQVHPLGGLAINDSGGLTHQFGAVPDNRASVLNITKGLVSQLQSLEDLGSFHRGLVSIENNKLMVFECYDGMAAIETAEQDITTRFNMMNTAELATLFKQECS